VGVKEERLHQFSHRSPSGSAPVDAVYSLQACLPVAMLKFGASSGKKKFGAS
jgi:hypothetical protein